jgi:hypothetical protein
MAKEPHGTSRAFVGIKLKGKSVEFIVGVLRDDEGMKEGGFYFHKGWTLKIF